MRAFLDLLWIATVIIGLVGGVCGCSGDSERTYPVFGKKDVSPQSDTLLVAADGIQDPGDAKGTGETQGKDVGEGSDEPDVLEAPLCKSETRELAWLAHVAVQESGEDAFDVDIRDVSASFYGDEVVVAWGEKYGDELGSGYATRLASDGSVSVPTQKIFNAVYPSTPRLRLATDGDHVMVVHDGQYPIPSEEFSGQDTSVVLATLLDDQLQISSSAVVTDLLANGWNVAADYPHVFYQNGAFTIAWNDWRMEEKIGYGQFYFQYNVLVALYGADLSSPFTGGLLASGKMVGTKRRPVVSKDVGTAVQVGSSSDRRIMINSVNAFLPIRVDYLPTVDFLDYYERDERRYLAWINEFDNGDSWDYVTEVRVVSEAVPKELSDNAARAQCCVTAGDMGCESAECRGKVCSSNADCCEDWTANCGQLALILCCSSMPLDAREETMEVEALTLVSGALYRGTRIVNFDRGVYVVWTENEKKEIFGEKDEEKVLKFVLQSLSDPTEQPSELAVQLPGRLLDIEDARVSDNQVELLSARLHEDGVTLELTTLCLP